jgi:hypothetical protein
MPHLWVQSELFFSVGDREFLAISSSRVYQPVGNMGVYACGEGDPAVLIMTFNAADESKPSELV